jgi:hypothetical protein
MSSDHFGSSPSNRSVSISADSAAGCWRRPGVKKEAGERLAPRFEDSHQRIAFEVRRREIFSDVRQSDAIESGANHDFHVVTINGPLTETVNDCFPLSNSQR